MAWRDGNYNSTNPDVAAYIERGDDDWIVYATYGNGGIKMSSRHAFAPPARAEPFATLEEAQSWAEANLPHPRDAEVEPEWSATPDDYITFHRAIKKAYRERGWVIFPLGFFTDIAADPSDVLPLKRVVKDGHLTRKVRYDSPSGNVLWDGAVGGEPPDWELGELACLADDLEEASALAIFYYQLNPELYEGTTRV